ncbi:DUF4287 domain-containing protein [Demequina sediminicola]|uniref:DUF4287 domain-containing protein n=1 Tax=Demequina sediminicola TaxID=1095026 RepID=UPI0007821169|nr:DUF4287 domain-containing protein [Demequina sediminicola]
MSEQRIVAPDIESGATLKGPVSYFPSIEKTYGKPMQHWVDIAVAGLAEGQAHMAVVSDLKDNHGMGHGHANAVVAWVKSRIET